MLIVKTLIHTILLPGTILVWLPYLLLSSGRELYHLGLGSLRFLGVIPVTVGLVIGLWCTRNFITVGRGTPNPLDPPKRVVSQGPYLWVRNPMYVCVMLILMGEVLLFESFKLLAYSAVVFLGFQAFVVLYEEPTLRRKFGASYEEYCEAVPRWLPGRRAQRKAGE